MVSMIYLMIFVRPFGSLFASKLDVSEVFEDFVILTPDTRIVHCANNHFIRKFLTDFLATLLKDVKMHAEGFFVSFVSIAARL